MCRYLTVGRRTQTEFGKITYATFSVFLVSSTPSCLLWVLKKFWIFVSVAYDWKSYTCKSYLYRLWMNTLRCPLVNIGSFFKAGITAAAAAVVVGNHWCIFNSWNSTFFFEMKTSAKCFWRENEKLGKSLYANWYLQIKPLAWYMFDNICFH